MSRKSEGVKRWRRTTKNRIVEAFGGKCCVCGYNKCNDALILHHLDPAQKEYSISAISRASALSWDTIIKELRKCIMMCSNCHKEVHAGITELPENPPKFNEYFADYKRLKTYKKDEFDTCPMCGNQKPKMNITCSLKCAAKKTRKVDWDSVDIIELRNSGMSNTNIGDMLNVSEASVRKRLKKMVGWGSGDRLDGVEGSIPS
jgi:hypothetical protein